MPWDNEEEFQFLLHGEEKVMKRQFSDPTIPAFFEAHPKKKYRVTPIKVSTGQVAFDVEGPDIDETLNELYQNMPIGCLDYIRALKGLRSSIFALKGARG